MKQNNTVKSYDGKDVNINAMKESLHIFPSFARKEIDNFGVPFLSNCCYKTYKCGCRIIGNGTLQFPLSIDFCSKHKLQ